MINEQLHIDPIKIEAHALDSSNNNNKPPLAANDKQLGTTTTLLQEGRIDDISVISGSTALDSKTNETR